MTATASLSRGDAAASRDEPVRPADTWSRRRVHLIAGAAWSVALVCWLVALTHTSTGDLGEWGLVAAFPVVWFVALAVVLAVLVRGLASTVLLPTGWLAAHMLLLTLILYGSAALVEDAPRLPWVYKHIAVTSYIEANGSVNPAIDIYQRWPGFFTWTAQLGELTGYPNALRWAGLAEPVFAVIDMLLVFALARTISRDARWCWAATAFFCLSNWVAQNYFAPQALGYTLYLFIVMMALVALRTSRPRRLGLWLESILERVLRVRPGDADVEGGEQLGTPGAAAPAFRAWVMVVMLAAFSAVVASHQLTPYLILLGLVPLFLLGYFRPVLLVVAMGFITLAYLVPNLGYIAQHFGVFSGFDPVANAVYTTVDRSTLQPASLWQAQATRLISGIVYATAAVGLVRRVRHGGVRSAVLVVWLLAAPVLVLAVQSYGGEGRLRIYLFSLPWASMAAAWAFRPGPRRPRLAHTVPLAVVLVTLAALMVSSYFQPEADYRTPRADVEAAYWLDQHIARNDIIITTAPTFPTLVGPHYDLVNLDTSLQDYKLYNPGRTTVQDLLGLAAGATDTSEPYRVFVVFSDNQYRYDQRHSLYAPGELADLEQGVAARSSTAVVYRTSSDRIYQLR